MPKLDTTLHVDMYRESRNARTISARVKRAWNALLGKDYIYGLEWGDPETNPPLRYIRDHFLLPYLKKETVAIEIGPGGGAGRVTWLAFRNYMPLIFIGNS